METWGVPSPERLTFFVNWAFIEMYFSPWDPIHISAASYLWNYKTNNLIGFHPGVQQNNDLP